MGWNLYADTYNNDSELSTGSKRVRLKFNKNIILNTVRTTIVLFNDPGLTNLQMKIYSDDSDSKGALLHTSTNTLTKAEILTGGNTNGIREIYFEFNNETFNKDTWYNFILVGSSSGLTSSSTIAWKHGWPDNVYRTGLDLDYEELSVSPYDLYCIGSTL